MRQQWTWLIFAVCLAVVLTAMGWTTRTVVRLDRAQAEARQRAEFEQTVRLAMWRMESALSPLIAQEGSYPFYAYESFSPLNGIFARGAADARGGEALIPSPLMAQANPQVVMHFQFDADGALKSPQVPVGAMRDLAEKQGYRSRQAIEEANDRLAALHKILSRDQLRSLLPAPQPPQQFAVAVPPPSPPEAQRITQWTADPIGQQAGQAFIQDNQARIMQQQRVQTLAMNNSFSNGLATDINQRQNSGHLNTSIGLMQPVWVDGLLLLARRVSMDGRELIQGSQLDWTLIRQTLLADTADLLPAATLEPAATAAAAARSAERQDLRLAALPVRLVPGAAAVGPTSLTPGLTYSLITAWTGVLLATLAAAVLLKGALALSERRAAFVSAVTHELRTPLTTFKLYTEMLEEGRVPEKDRQRQYLATLRSQADRLSHLVENVLAYARLDKGRQPRKCVAVSIDEMLSHMTPRLAERAAQAGASLQFESLGPIPGESTHVLADTPTVEQILLNLVDNACKYAASTEDRAIEILASADRESGLIRVRDHGPGISAGERGRLFRPFHKSAHQAANSAPGVGLGLSLSRRLAREMGGDLWLDARVADGACFVLRLPAASHGSRPGLGSGLHRPGDENVRP
jgi:signal transduction histidine kinase